MRFLLAIALILNALAPYAVQAAVGARQDKILICTAEGFRFVSAAEYSLPAAPVQKHTPQCMLCLLAAGPVVALAAPLLPYHTLPAAKIAALWQLEIPVKALAISLFRYAPLGSRAPPSFS